MSKKDDDDQSNNNSDDGTSPKFWSNLEDELTRHIRELRNRTNFETHQPDVLNHTIEFESAAEPKQELDAPQWRAPQAAPINQSVADEQYQIAESSPLNGNVEFSMMLKRAREARNYAPTCTSTISAYERVLAYAEEWQGDHEIIFALQELSNIYIESEKFPKALKTLKILFRRQQAMLGKSHTILAPIEMQMGICLHRLNETYDAIKTLRSAVVRYQQSESADTEAFIECLCALSSVYRTDNKTASARSSIKQGYKVLSATEATIKTQCKLLEELAAVLLCEHRYPAAAAAYTRVVEMKKELLQTEFADIVRPLIDLGLCNFSVRNHDAAEQALLEAAEMYHQLKYNDPNLLSRLLETFSGIMRHQGQFIQADLLDEAAMEMRGRTALLGGHALYGELISNARIAEARGDWDSAESQYREALCALEAQYHRRSPHRLLILAKFYLRTQPKSMQRIGLLSEIEDSVNELFCGAFVQTKAGLERIALIFRLSGNKEAANDILALCAQLPEGSLTICNFENLLPPVPKRLEQLDDFTDADLIDGEPITDIESLGGLPFKDGLPFFE